MNSKQKTEPEKIITRGGIWIISFQLEGLCAGLRALVPGGIDPGPASYRILRKLRDEWKSLSTGKAMEDLPDIDEKLSPAELLVLAETIRATVLSFMTPEELHERKSYGVGFQATGTDAT